MSRYLLPISFIMLFMIAFQSMQFQQDSFSKLHNETLRQIGEKTRKIQNTWLALAIEKEGSPESVISGNLQKLLSPSLAKLTFINEDRDAVIMWQANNPSPEDSFTVKSDTIKFNNSTIALEFTYDKRSLLVNLYKHQKLQQLLTILLITIIFIFAIFGLLTLQAKTTQKKNRIVAEMKQQEFENQLDLIKLEKSEKDMRLQVVEKEEQLIQADKMSSLGVIASGIAHEVNNPNTYIHLNAKTLEKAWADTLKLIQQQVNDDTKIAGIPFKIMKDRIPALTQSITEGSERITKIISDLKDFASTQETQNKQSDLINIKSIIDTSVRLTENFIHKATDDFTIQNNQDIFVMGSAQKLEQVIINLLINSSQSLTSQNQTISVATKIISGNAIITVQDEGCGIPKEVIANVFDPFFSTKKDDGGTGLGLSISFGIIKDMNGTIQVKSDQTKGTLFTITLPLAQKGNN